jgi:hypothetical protein
MYNLYLLYSSDPLTRATYFSTMVVLALYLIDQIKKLPTPSLVQPTTIPIGQPTTVENAREKLRVYSTFDQMLSELLCNSGQRFQVGVVTGMRTVYASLQVVEKIDNLLQKEAYLFDQLTKNYWRESKLTIYSGVNPGQDIVVDLADKLQAHVKGEIEKLKKTLNLE